MRVSGLPVLGLAMALLVAGCNSSSSSSSNVPDDQSPELSLTLLHINDHHSRLQPAASNRLLSSPPEQATATPLRPRKTSSRHWKPGSVRGEEDSMVMEAYCLNG
jgi:2',3'-cyclic-nucleotide 2'-phosphodiesterase (5'-nucleotidase family)